MKPYQVVTQSQANVLLLQAILNIPDDDPQIEFVAAGGWSRVDSYARTLLIEDKANVAVVVDADTTDPNNVDSRRRFLHRSLGEVKIHRNFHVAVIVPEIEALLFQEHSILKHFVGKPVSDTDIVSANWEPKKVLGRILPSYNDAQFFQSRLSGIDLSPLANNASMEKLKTFLSHSRQAATAAR